MYEDLQQLLNTLPTSGRVRLERLLERTSRPDMVDLRTPLFNEAPREDILEALERAIGHTEFEDYEGIDQHERDKVGPMSMRLASADRRQDWEAYGTQKFNPNEAALHNAVEKIRARIPKSSLRSLSIMGSYERAPKDTWRGLPWCVSSKDYDDWYIDKSSTIRSWEEIYPFVLGWRGQNRGLKELPKQRVVAMATKVDGIMFGRLLYPLMEALRRIPGHSAWFSNVEVDRAVTTLLANAKGRLIISGDFSGFDASIPHTMFEVLRDLYKWWFIAEDHPLIDIMIDYIENARLVVPGGLFVKNDRGGEWSGHEFTNMDDTIVSEVAYEYVAECERTDVRNEETLGDDAVVTYQEDIEPQIVAKHLAELGLSSNPDKLFTSLDACHFLQNWHSTRYLKGGVAVGCHSPYRTIGHSISMERWTRGWTMWLYTARLIMQTENVKNDPRFRNYVLFVKQGDKILSSGVDPEIVFRKAGGSENVRTVLNIASFPFNQQDPAKVNIFRTTEVLREIMSGMVH